MDPKLSTTTPARSEFLEQANLAQAALESLIGVMGLEPKNRDDDMARLVINKAIKAIVSP